MRIANQRAATDNLAGRHREQACDCTPLDFLDPRGQYPWLADIARQKQQVMRGQLSREFKHRRFISLRHQPEFDRPRFGRDLPRIGSLFTHVDLTPSQESSFGHSRFTALAPATRLTWPPFSTTSSLSVEPTFLISGFAAS